MKRKITIEVHGEGIKVSPTKLLESLSYDNLTLIKIEEKDLKDEP